MSDTDTDAIPVTRSLIRGDGVCTCVQNLREARPEPVRTISPTEPSFHPARSSVDDRQIGRETVGFMNRQYGSSLKEGHLLQVGGGRANFDLITGLEESTKRAPAQAARR